MSASIAVSGLLLSSTGSALLRKVLFQISGTGLGGTFHTFEKPWFTTFESAASCWVSILLYWILKRLPDGEQPSDDLEALEPLLANGEKGEDDPNPFQEEKATDGNPAAQAKEAAGTTTWREIATLALPGMFSVVSIVVQGIGLKYISASLSMMLSGSCVVFTAILSVLLLHCRLNQLHLTGMGLAIGGILIVSVSNLIWPEVSHSTHHHNALPPSDMQMLFWGRPIAGPQKSGEVILGIGLTLLSTLILAGRLVSEEFALRGTQMHPLQVLGYEGMWGTLGVGFIGLPLAWLLPGEDIGGCQENLADSILLLCQSWGISVTNLFFFLSVVGLNAFGLIVTRRLGSIFRAVLLTSRTASVWAVDLVLFYLHIGGGRVGEPWENPGSWFQLMGFALLLAGTIVYAQGSSAVAQDKEVNEADEPEDEGAQGWRPSEVSAVTRLRPYTSLYIPHGPRSIRRGRSSTGLERMAQSLPRTAMVTNDHSLPRAPDLFQSHSYHPGILTGSSPQSLPSTVGATGQSTSHSSLFLQTLTHRSSWVLPPEPMLYRKDSFRDLEGGVSPSAASTSGFGRATNCDNDSLEDIEQPSSSGSRQSPQHRSQRRKSVKRMPSVRESSFESARGPARAEQLDAAEKLEESSSSQSLPRKAVVGATDGAMMSKRPIFGQSPAPHVLLSRRSAGQMMSAQKAPLSPFNKDEEEAETLRLPDERKLESGLLRQQQPNVTGERSSGGSSSSRSSILGQSPTPAKLMERRSADKRRSQHLPPFEETAESSDSSALETSDEEPTAPTAEHHATTTCGDMQQSSQNVVQPSKAGGLRHSKVLGGSTDSLQWNGEPMSL